MSLPLTVMLLSLVALALLRVPLGIAMLASGIAYLGASGQDIGLVAEQVSGRLFSSTALVAIPMFIFAANVMNAGTVTERLLSFASALVGRWRGGFAHVNVLSSLIFSGMSGSAVADVAGPGRVIMTMMTANGRYTPGFAGAVTAASATIGPIIPPSIPMVLYALVSNASVGALFLGGVIPGLLMAAALMLTLLLIGRRRGFSCDEPVGSRDLLRRTLRALPPLLMPAILLGCIYSGVTTPTEAAAVAALYALLLAMLVYRALGPRGLYTVLVDTVRSTGVVSVAVAGAFILNYAVENERLPEALATFLQSLDLGPLALLIAVNILFLLLGCVLDISVMLLVLVPLLVPSLVLAGIDLVHFGVVIVINMMIGLVTPPYGLLLFVIAALNGTSLRAIIGEIWPFVLVLVVVLFLLVLVPDLVLWLPSQLN